VIDCEKQRPSATTLGTRLGNMKGGSDVWRNIPVVAGSSVRADPAAMALRIPQLVETTRIANKHGGDEI
jgi:hypothetical protein